MRNGTLIMEVNTVNSIEEPQEGEMEDLELSMQALDLDIEHHTEDYKTTNATEMGADLIFPSDQLFTSVPDGSVQLRESFDVIEPPITVSTLLHNTCKKYADRTALVYKKNKDWKSVPYSEYLCTVRTAAKAFLKLGLERYHSVCILGSNAPEWLYADLAAILAGGFACGIYTTNSPEECLHCLVTSQANIVVVENDVQLQKVLQVRDKAPLLKAIVQYSGKPRDPTVYSWEEVLEMGSREMDHNLDSVGSTLAANQCCTIAFTSGTEGLPKPVMLSHDNMIFDAKMAIKYLEMEEGAERFLSFLPLSHAAAQEIDIYVPLILGATLFIADKEALKNTLIENLRVARPTMLFAIPRIWEKVKEGIENREKKSSRLKQFIITCAKSVALSHYESIADSHVGEPVLFRFFRNVVYSKIKESMGLNFCKHFLCGAATIPIELKQHMSSYDMPISEAYGLIECTACHCVSKPTDFEFNSSGRTLSGMRTRIHEPDEHGFGEICMYGRHVFMGYLNDPEKTSAAIDAEGWLHSGDVGTCDDNLFIQVTGRIKDLIIMADGKTISPVIIEQNLKRELPVISQAIVVGDGKQYLSALLTFKCNLYNESGIYTDELAPETKEWCRSLGCHYKTITEIVEKKPTKVYDAVQKAVDRANSMAMSNSYRLQRYNILPRDLSIVSGELGPTMKVVRRVAYENFRDEIEQLYH